MSALLLGLATFAVICASPGPAVIAVLSTAMARGLAAALSLTMGLTVALGAWGVLAALGFGAVLAAAPAALTALKIVGGAYLLWLAWCAGRAALSAAPEAVSAPRAGFRAGLLLNLSNPKAVLAWSATIAVGAPPDAPLAAFVLVPLCMAATVAIYVAYAAVFSLPAMRRGYRAARRWIEGATAALLGAAGVSLLAWRGRLD